MMKKYIAFGLALILSCATYAQDKIKVACVGNSITYGSGVADREVNAYPVKLQGMLGDKYEVGNFGKPGATLLNKGHRPYTQQQEYKDALAFAGDIVVIHLGINDTDPRNWPNYRDEFIGDYRSLMQSFREVNPKVRFLLARMTPLSDRHWRFESGTRDWHAEIQLAIECIAKAEGVQLIDFHEPPLVNCMASIPTCFKLLAQLVRLARERTSAVAGMINPARTAITKITVNNSIRV